MATIAIFVLTLFLMLKKPWNLHEAWATLIGAALMLATGALTTAQAVQSVANGGDVLLFLFALMLLSALLDRAGFFEWCALHAVRAAGGRGQTLYRNVFLVGAGVTAFLSLDTTAIILTPIVLSFVRKLKINARPFLMACAFIANTGSLLLPVSNLTNLLFQHALKFSFLEFVGQMFLPQIAVVALNYWLFILIFKKELPETFDDNLPEPRSAVHSEAFFKTAVATVALITVGYFAGSLLHIEPYVIALAGCTALLIAGFWTRQIKVKELVHHISWELFPFVVGLFIVIRAVENLGLSRAAETALKQLTPGSVIEMLAVAFASALGSNVVNNVPMALLAISILEGARQSASHAAAYAALLGCNLGPNLTIAGSLATMLVISRARKGGEDLKALDFFQTGLKVTPLLLIIATLLLWVTTSIVGGKS